MLISGIIGLIVVHASINYIAYEEKMLAFFAFCQNSMDYNFPLHKSLDIVLDLQGHYDRFSWTGVTGGNLNLVTFESGRSCSVCSS